MVGSSFSYLGGGCLGKFTFGDVTIVGEGLQMLTYVHHLWSLISEGSLACHTFCDTGHPFITVISEDLIHVWQWSCHYLF